SEDLDAAAKLLLHLQRRISVLHLKARSENLEQRQIWCALRVRRALALEPGHGLASERLPELEEQTRLPNAGVADHAHDLPAARLRFLPARHEASELLLPAGERAQSALDPNLETGPAPATSRDVPDAHRLGASLDGQEPEVF